MKAKTRVWRRPSLRDVEAKSDELNKLFRNQRSEVDKSSTGHLNPNRISRRRIVREQSALCDTKEQGVSPEANAHLRQIMRWKNEKNYYMATLCQDLFESWILQLEWGRVDGRRRRHEELVFDSESSAQKALLDIDIKQHNIH